MSARESIAIITMASSKVSTAESSLEEQKGKRQIDVMFPCNEWRSLKGGLSPFKREFAINLSEARTAGMKIHCYVSKSDDQDIEDAKQHGVNIITAQNVPGSADPLSCFMSPPSELPNPQLVIGNGRKLRSPAYFLVQNAICSRTL